MKKTAKITFVLYASCLSFSLLHTNVKAGDVAFRSGIESTAHIYETKKNDATNYEDNQAIVIIPSLLSTYSSKGLTASILAEHTVVKQDRDEVGADKNYTEFQYNGVFTLIPKSMILGFTGSRDYRVLNQLEADFGDKVLSPGELTSYKRNGVDFNFSIPNPKYIGLSIQAAYNESNSEESLESSLGIDTKSTSSSINLYQGNKIRGIRFNLSAQNSTSKRSNYNDFNSTNLNGSLGFSLIGNTDFILTGSIDEYDTDVTSDTPSARANGIDSNSYGAGFEWTPREGRNIRLTYNQLEELSGNTQYIGFNSNWSFSSRTTVGIDVSKKFYGDAYNFSLSQNLKHLRVSMSYNENVTSYSNLDITTTPHLFVCALGATDLADCFQPDSSDYILQAGEGFLNLNQFEVNITEEVFLQKSGNINIGYEKRKVKASINASYGKTEYLESDRESANRRLNASVSYKLGRKTNLGLTSSISRRTDYSSERADTIKSIEASFNRNLNTKTTLNLAAKIMDRESDNIARDLTDRRITLGLNYTF